MADVKVFDVNKLGLRPQKRKEMQYRETNNGVSGMSGLVEVTITEMVPTSHLNDEDAWTLSEAGAEWVKTPAALKGHPKWMARFMERKWFADKKPVAPKVEDEPEEEPEEPEAEGNVKRHRGRPARRSGR